MIYQGFDNWADVQSQFSTDAPEPEQVLLARYTYEDYEGDALVIFSNGGALFMVTGSHCSCYGLEGQWEPEETTPEVLRSLRYCQDAAFLERLAHWENGPDLLTWKPPTLVATGLPLTDELRRLFQPWGNLTGLRVEGADIVAEFGTVTVRFIVGSVVS